MDGDSGALLDVMVLGVSIFTLVILFIGALLGSAVLFKVLALLEALKDRAMNAEGALKDLTDALKGLTAGGRITITQHTNDVGGDNKIEVDS